MSEETERMMREEELEEKLRSLRFKGPEAVLRERTLLAVRRTLTGERPAPRAGHPLQWWREALLTAAILVCLLALPRMTSSPAMREMAVAMEETAGASILSVLDLDEDFADHVSARLGFKGRASSQYDTLQYHLKNEV